jgi:ComEC/Rec2-related protein
VRIRRAAVIILLAIASGIVLQSWFDVALLYCIPLALIAVMLSFWERRFLYMLIVVLSAANFTLQGSTDMDYGDRDLTFSGIVVSEDQYGHYAKLLLHIDNIYIANDTIDHYIPVEYYTYKQDVFLGKRLTIKGRLKPSHYAQRPSILNGKIVSVAVPKHILGVVFHPLRNYMDGLLRRSFTDEHYAIASGLTLGGSGRLGEELKGVFARAGILHILAVSGLHVGFVSLFLGFLFFFVPIDRRLKFAIVMFGLFVYAGVTGFRPSVCRATLMAFLFGLALVLQRNVNHIHLLNITAIAFLVVKPSLFFEVGAQLSFAAVYGILYLYPRLDMLLISHVRRRFLRLLLAPMAVSFSAQLFVAPLLVFYFQRLPVYAVFSNLLVVPIAASIIFMLFLCFLAGLVWIAIVKVIALPVSLLITALLVLSRFFAAIPCSTISLTASPVFIIPLYLCAWRKARRWVFWFMIALFAASHLAYSGECLTVRVSSNGILITTPCGEDILISEQRTSAPIYLLEKHGGQEVDYLVAPERNIDVKKGYVEMPGKLQFAKIMVGELGIHVSKRVSIRFRGVDIECEQISARHGGKEGIVYILTDGRRKKVLRTYGYLSIIERMVLDMRLTIARLRLLL